MGAAYGKHETCIQDFGGKMRVGMRLSKDRPIIRKQDERVWSGSS
jgi:hypothetical protein